MAASKDTIYIDNEDEITAVIEKVINATHKVVALVLPKRATVFQSPVNMKLLKKKKKNASKSLVLITSDKGILAIASVSGVHVAKTLQTKPAIPVMEHATTGDGANPETNPAATDDAIELDNSVAESVATDAERAKSTKKIMKIPDFSSFRFKVGLAIVSVFTLAVLWFIGFVVMPKATVTLNTDTSTTTVTATATLAVGQEELDVENTIIPAERVQVEKIESVTVEATGQKNIGNRATGVITLTNCIDDGEQKVIPAGTQFSKDGKSFLTTEQVILQPALVSAGTCRSADFGLSENVDVQAAESGSDFNVSEGTFNSSISGIRAFGSDMTGGTSEIVTVISQEDVNRAAQELNGTTRTAALAEMRSQLQESGQVAIEETLSEGEPKIESEPAVDEESEEVTVTITVSYSMQGASSEDISRVIDSKIRENMDDQQKNIKDNGLSTVEFEVVNRLNEAETELAMQTVATLGPDINESALREELVGKKRGDIEKQVEAIDGVRSVSVEYSPIWITTTPKSADKIEIVINESDDN